MKGGIVARINNLGSSDDGAGGPSKGKPWIMKTTATSLVPSIPGEIGVLVSPPKSKPNGGVEDDPHVEAVHAAAAAKTAKQEEEVIVLDGSLYI